MSKPVRYIYLACLALLGAVAVVLILTRNSAPPTATIKVEPRANEHVVATAPQSNRAADSNTTNRPNQLPVVRDEIVETSDGVQLVASPVTAFDAPATPSTQLHFLIVEEGTRLPLERVTVSLSVEGEKEKLEQVTAANGQTFFSNIAPGTYAVRLIWGRREPVEMGEVTALENRRVFQDYEYPSRTKYRFLLVDEQDKPLPYHDVRVGLPLFRWSEESPVQYTDAKSNGDGYLEIMAYPDLRPIFLQSSARELFSAEPQRGWGNPYAYRNELRENREPKIYVRERVVKATGVLVNPPADSNSTGYIASVRGTSVTYWTLPVENNQFSFLAPAGESVQVSLTRHVAPELSRAGLSREKNINVQLPETPGDFTFTIPFDNRVTVNGRVILPDGEPATGVRIRAVGFGNGSAARALQREVEQQSDARWGSSFGRGESSFLSEPSDREGRFSIQLTEASEYLFAPEPDALPADTKGADPLTIKWAELSSGEEVLILLKFSSLIWGEVVDEEDTPVAGARINLRGEALNYNASPYAVRTNGVGFFEMNVPPIKDADKIREGSNRLYVTAYRDGMQGLAPVQPDSKKMTRVRLHKEVSGTLVVTDNGVPVPKIEISSYFSTNQFNRPVERRGVRTRENSDGRYSFDQVPRGITWFNISKPGAPPSQMKTVRVPNNARDNQQIKVDIGVTGKAGG